MSSTQEIPIVYPQLDPPSSSSSYAETGQWGAPSKPQDPSSIGLGVVGPHESASYPPTAPAPAPAPATANPYITASPASGFTGKSKCDICSSYIYICICSGGGVFFSPVCIETYAEFT